MSVHCAGWERFNDEEYVEHLRSTAVIALASRSSLMNHFRMARKE
ncbi:hypothetical protein [Nocardiopsis rhodophaea]